jgi:hypothetical protein
LGGKGVSGNSPQEIAEEFKDLFIQINLRHYFKRHEIAIDELPSSLQLT